MDEPPSRRPPESVRARPRGSVRIGRVAGAEVLVSSSWFVVAALIAVVVAPRAEQVEPGIGGWKYVAGFAFAVIFYLSILLHEASHAWVARRYGYPVSSITLHFLGGMTAVEGEARTAREEFWIAVVGPLTSLAVGGGALALWFVTPDGLARVAVEGLAGANLLLGVLNLVPGMPLDGGRVLRAAVWRWSGSSHAGAVAAGWGGRAVAVLVLSWPVWQSEVLGVRPELVDYLLVLLLGGFLWAGATASLVQARLRRRLPALAARRLARRSLSVPPELPLSEAVRRAQQAQAGGIVTVDPDGRPLGIVSEAALLAVPEERRPWVPVSTLARGLQHGMALPVDLAGEQLVAALSRHPSPEYLLLDPDGAIYGVLSAADVDRAFRQVAH